MTKQELSEILHNACDSVSDSITDMDHVNKYPRIVYWSYAWQDVMASGDAYADERTYQVSIWGQVPPEQNPAVLAVRDGLRSAGVHPEFRHEFVTDERAWHTYLSVDVLE